MLIRIASQGVALLLLLIVSSLVGGGCETALAQYQVNVGAIYAPAPFVETADIPEPFGLDVLPVTEGGILGKWSGLVADIHAETEILAHCRASIVGCPPAAQKFLAVIADGRAHEGRARFGVINRAINMAIEPMSDLAQWGVIDRWSAPLVTLATGRGDCEDYAIAKYVALEEAGVAEDDLRLVIVRDLVLGQDHAVVTARLDDKWIVLDNRRLALLDDDEMPHVQPRFVLGRDGVKQFAPALMAAAHDGAQDGVHDGPAPSALGP